MSAPRWVLDTNVVLDCLYFADAGARPLWRAVEAGAALALADAATLDEWRRVLAYRQFGLAPDAQGRLYADYLARATLVTATDQPALPRCRDPADQKFLRLAAVGQAVLLVTKDRDLLRLRKNRWLGFRIVTPGEVALGGATEESAAAGVRCGSVNAAAGVQGGSSDP